MSELILTLAGLVSFALVHAAHPRRFPYGEARWHRLAGRFAAASLGGPRRTLHALAVVVLALGLGGARYGLHPLRTVEALIITVLSFTTAGSALVLAAPLWPRATWRLCVAAAVALPILVAFSLATSLSTSLAAQVLHG